MKSNLAVDTLVDAVTTVSIFVFCQDLNRQFSSNPAAERMSCIGTPSLRYLPAKPEQPS